MTLIIYVDLHIIIGYNILLCKPLDTHGVDCPAASIWFEIWGLVDPVNQISIFPGKFPKNFNFFRQFKTKFDFQAKISHLQLLLVKLFYFSSKVTTFEHTSCTL